MGFFDKALKKVQDVGENIAASANNVKTVVETSVQDTMEITGLKRQIRELEKEMDAQYLQIGKKYAEFVADMDDAEPETAENEAAEATESSEVIDEVKEEAIDEVKAEDVAETVDEAKEEAADETIDEVKAEDTAETIDEEKEVSEEPAEDKVAEESDEDEEPVFDVSDFLTIIKQDQAKKKELENQLAEVEKRALIYRTNSEFRHIFSELLGNKPHEVLYILRFSLETFAKFRILCSNSHRTGIQITYAHHHTAKRYKRSCRKSEFFRSQKCRDRHISSAHQFSVCFDLHTFTQSVLDQCLMSLSQTKFPRKSRIVDGTFRSSTGTAVVTGNQNYLCSCFCHTCCYGSDACF